MKQKFWLFFALFITIHCSNSDKDDDSTVGDGCYSSDEENTVFGDTAGLTEAFDDLDINEKANINNRLNQPLAASSPNIPRPLSCIDGNGREVDWWFLYQQPGSTRYLYYSSLDAQADRNAFLPRFPKIVSNGRSLYGDALKNALPKNPADIFDTNLAKKGQHFFCMSLPRESVELVEKSKKHFEVPVDFNSAHVKFLHKYLKTIHPAIMGTNFSDHNKAHQLWRRYFSLFQVPTDQAIEYLHKPDKNQQNLAYSHNNLPSFKKQVIPENLQHVFPLSSSKFHVLADGTIKKADHFYSRWDSSFASQNGCFNGSESTCLSSFETRTTNLQSRITLKFFAKHGLVHMDLYDDWATLQLIQSQKSLENHYTGNVIDRYGLLVQSWIDSRIELPRKPDKKIFDSNGKLMATVHIDNVSHYDMPVKNQRPVRFDTGHKDHSKWAVSFALDTLNTDYDLNDAENVFVPSVFVTDLNRTYTQARLKSDRQGRGGGAVVTGSVNLWRALMKLNPRVGKQDQERFANSTKNRARALQSRLLPHSKSLNSSSFSLPLDPLRPALFRSLRLSKKESKKPSRKSVDFVPFLNEMQKFIKIAENRPEHVAFFAFQRMFKAFNNGNVLGQAETAWNREKEKQNRKEKNDKEYSCLLQMPEIVTIPSLHLHRQIPTDHQYDDESLKRAELESQEPHIVKNKEGILTRVDIFKSWLDRFHKLPRHEETQSEPITQVDSSTQTGDNVTEENYDYYYDLLNILNKPDQKHKSEEEQEQLSGDEDELYDDYSYEYQHQAYINSHNYRDDESVSDFSNREIDYSDEDEFDEEKYDPYSGYYEEERDENNSSVSDSDRDSDKDSDRDSDSDEDQGTEYSDDD